MLLAAACAEAAPAGGDGAVGDSGGASVDDSATLGDLDAEPADGGVAERPGGSVGEPVRDGVGLGRDVGGGLSEPAGEVSGVSPNRGFVSFSADVSCAFRADGSTGCWHWPRRPELLEFPESATGWITIDGSRTGGMCGIHTDGALQCWGGEDFHAGPTATCGLRPDGEAECWGFDAPDGRPRPLDWDPQAGPFVAVSVGNGYACGLRPSADPART